MTTRSFRLLCLGITGLAGAALSGCSDDESPTLWRSVTLPPLAVQPVFVSDVQFDGMKGAAVGFSVSHFDISTRYRPIVYRTDNGGETWSGATEPPSTPPVNPVFTGLEWVGGQIVLVGTSTSSPVIHVRPVLFEGGQPEWTQVDLGLEEGWIEGIARGPDGTLRAVGRSTQGLSLIRPPNGAWSVDDSGFETPDAYKGLIDVVYGGDRFYAAGFDNWGPRYDVVKQNSGSGWEPVETPWGNDNAGDILAVAVTSSGSLLIGGTRHSGPASGGPLEAWLMMRTETGTWTEIVLPDPVELDAVHDILATTNAVFVACGDLVIHILRLEPDLDVVDEGPGTQGRIRSLTEGPDGSIWAAGHSPGRGVLLRRRAD